MLYSIFPRPWNQSRNLHKSSFRQIHFFSKCFPTLVTKCNYCTIIFFGVSIAAFLCHFSQDRCEALDKNSMVLLVRHHISISEYSLCCRRTLWTTSVVDRFPLWVTLYPMTIKLNSWTRHEFLWSHLTEIHFFFSLLNTLFLFFTKQQSMQSLYFLAYLFRRCF